MQRLPTLTVRQAAFVREYLVDLDAPRAAVRAGYSIKGVTGPEQRRNAYRLLEHPKVQAHLAAAQRERFEKTRINGAEILGELYRLARVDLGQAFNDDGTLKPLREIPEDVRRAMAGFEVEELYSGTGDARVWIGRTKKVRFWDKNRALELLAKHLNLLNEQPVVPVTVNANIIYRAVYGGQPVAVNGDAASNGHTLPS